MPDIYEICSSLGETVQSLSLLLADTNFNYQHASSEHKAALVEIKSLNDNLNIMQQQNQALLKDIEQLENDLQSTTSEIKNLRELITKRSKK